MSAFEHTLKEHLVSYRIVVCASSGASLSTGRPAVNSLYVNNYMGCSSGTLPAARRRLVTMDTLGWLVRRQLPWRPLSGATPAPRQATAPVPTAGRVASAPVTGTRTSSNGQ